MRVRQEVQEMPRGKPLGHGSRLLAGPFNRSRQFADGQLAVWSRYTAVRSARRFECVYNNSELPTVNCGLPTLKSTSQAQRADDGCCGAVVSPQPGHATLLNPKQGERVSLAIRELPAAERPRERLRSHVA